MKLNYRRVAGIRGSFWGIDNEKGRDLSALLIGPWKVSLPVFTNVGPVLERLLALTLSICKIREGGRTRSIWTTLQDLGPHAAKLTPEYLAESPGATQRAIRSSQARQIRVTDPPWTMPNAGRRTVFRLLLRCESQQLGSWVHGASQQRRGRRTPTESPGL
ncbi:uncharacterized protein CLUP02_01735 [Colletotrichum lupini]|uniref:Uncharacterized protein n=1 Tax=Colletotrichum lupini TaxID=145971 RepID=A0A9Q8W9Z6_9PEZI|nr:uncharacterized protein CLUP02_01735 [Colletotrichum lupini]UQC75082.1 hypothetical protein CLUP02_01735 [Colletotrichum lupini]